MSKYTHPIRVKNPNSSHFLVKVRPGQNILLELDDELFPNHKINLLPQNYLFFLNKQKTNNFLSYTIGHEKQLHSWAEHSSAYMGEIWIESEKKSARLIVVLDSINELKSNFIAVVNPDYIDLRITPGDIIEIILFNSRIDQRYEWNWQFSPETDADVELISESVFDPQAYSNNTLVADCPQFAYSRLPRIIKSHTQYHFWFRFDKKLISLMDNLSGLNQLGTFQFVGSPIDQKETGVIENCVENCFSIYANFHKKYKMKILHSLLLPKNENDYNHSHFLINKNLSILNSSKKRKEYLIKDVDIKLIDTKFLEQGCYTTSADPYFYKQKKLSHKLDFEDHYLQENVPYRSDNFDIL